MNTELIAAELQQITILLEQITGLASNWNGTVELITNANFHGKKPFTCSILINAMLAEQNLRWRTLIHEVLHALSAGYNRLDFEANRGWEEGVVEKLQRIVRPTVLQTLGVTVEENFFQSTDQTHLFNVYIDALEQIRSVLGTQEQEFYLDLLRTPIRDRNASLLKQALALEPDHRKQALTVLSSSNQKLKGQLR